MKSKKVKPESVDNTGQLIINKKQKSRWERTKAAFFDCWQLYLLLLLPMLYMLVFHYFPMYGAQIAFRDYKPVDGIWGSEWVGFEHFIRFFDYYQFKDIMLNTLEISIYGLIVGVPFPVILAILLKYCPNKKFGKGVQIITYAPHFISVVVMVSIIMKTLDPRNGLINNVLALFGIEYNLNLLAMPEAFSSVYVWSGIWQTMGFSAIIYIAILTGVDISLHEAAMVDGANVVQRIRHIDFPALIPQITILLILSLGRILNVGFEKTLLMQNSLNASSSEVISTYVYKMGIAASFPDVSYTSAVGLFQSVIAFILIFVVNKVARKYGEMSLW